MKKKIIAVVLAVVVLVGGIVAGTIAYLADIDSDVNVMTMGNVYIAQHEYERVVENGAWVSADEADADGFTPDKVQEFTQNKPLYPAVFRDGSIKWDDRATDHKQSWAQIDAPGSNLLYDDSVKNVQDKFVFVENTGKSAAYVRTWFAFEQGTMDAARFDDVIVTNFNETNWALETVATDVAIGDTEYVLKVATYLGDDDDLGVLASKTVSYASLLQVYMKPEATNDDCAVFGNTYEILALSQAVQTEGFADAESALNTAFGTAHPWGDLTSDEIADDASLKDALQNPDASTIMVELTEDVTYDVAAWAGNGMGGETTEQIVINGNGHKITFNNTDSDWNNIVTNGAELVINNAVIDNSGYDATSGTWNAHSIVFNCDVVLTDVVCLNAIALEGNATLNNVTVTDDSTGDAYMIWITATAKKVTLNNCTVDATGSDGSDRGIKIDNQYLDNSEIGLVELTVKNTRIVSEKKAAILVKSPAGAKIVVDNVDITGVAADTVNAVWVDADAADYADLVTVIGATKIVES